MILIAFGISEKCKAKKVISTDVLSICFSCNDEREICFGTIKNKLDKRHFVFLNFKTSTSLQ